MLQTKGKFYCLLLKQAGPCMKLIFIFLTCHFISFICYFCFTFVETNHGLLYIICMCVPWCFASLVYKLNGNKYWMMLYWLLLNCDALCACNLLSSQLEMNVGTEYKLLFKRCCSFMHPASRVLTRKLGLVLTYVFGDWKHIVLKMSQNKNMKLVSFCTDTISWIYLPGGC